MAESHTGRGFKPKFAIGDYARVGGKGRPLPACYPWLLRGRLLKVVGIYGHIAGGHIEYQFAARRGRPGPILASFDLRRPYERDRLPGGGRKSLSNKR